MSIEKYKEYIEYMKRHPISWAEEMLNIKLTWYQKIKLFIQIKILDWKEKRIKYYKMR